MNTKEDRDVLADQFACLMPEFTPFALAKNIKKYAREHDLFERFGKPAAT